MILKRGKITIIVKQDTFVLLKNSTETQKSNEICQVLAVHFFSQEGLAITSFFFPPFGQKTLK